MNNPNQSEHDCEADHESDVELGDGIKASESPDHLDESATPNVPGLIQPTRKSMNQAEKGFMTVGAMETRRNKGTKKK